MTPNGTFNVRVYGLWVDAARRVLLTEERIGRHTYVKFPGGGLDYGEGVADCLRREWREETGHDLTQFRHFYTTDFFQASAFRPDEQIISIYYRVEPEHPADVVPNDPNILRFRWEALDGSFEPSLPIDLVVWRLLRDEPRLFPKIIVS